MQYGVQIGPRRAETSTVVYVSVESRKPLLAITIDVSCQRVAGALRCSKERVEEFTFSRSSFKFEWAIRSAPGIASSETRLEFFEIGE